MKVKFRLHDQPDLVYTTTVPSRNTPIKRIRAITSAELNGTPESVRLIYAGKQLEDSQTLFHCNFRDSDIILVMLRKHLQSEKPGTEKLVPTLDDSKDPTKIVQDSEDGNEQEYFCSVCKNKDDKKCNDCGCTICGGKDDDENTLVCDECQMYFHMKCLSPPLKEIPKGDWYCPTCENDPSVIVAPGQEPAISKKKAMMPSATTTKDWDRGNSCVGLSRKCTVVGPDHVGPIPGVPVGSSWRFRINVAEAGVHRPPVAGISGKAATGAVSIVLAAGYPEDKDEGLEFTYTGAGGRELKEGNKRIAQQTKNQELTGVNEALARTCDCPISLKGGVAKNWKKSRGIRVVRSSKLKKHNAEFAPEAGNRYDGIYKIVKYWPEKGESGYDVWRYLMRRDDPEPAPWTQEGKARTKALGLEMYDPDVTPKALNDRNYEIPKGISDLMAEDSANVRSWNAIHQRKLSSLSEFLEAVFGDVFSCAICKDKLVSPVTSSCGHNTCQRCLSDAFKNMGKQCPTCRADLSKDLNKVNIQLEAVFSKLMTLAPADDEKAAGEPGSKDLKPLSSESSITKAMENVSRPPTQTDLSPSMTSQKRRAPVNTQSNDSSKKRSRRLFKK